MSPFCEREVEVEVPNFGTEKEGYIEELDEELECESLDIDFFCGNFESLKPYQFNVRKK